MRSARPWALDAARQAGFDLAVGLDVERRGFGELERPIAVAAVHAGVQAAVAGAGCGASDGRAAGNGVRHAGENILASHDAGGAKREVEVVGQRHVDGRWRGLLDDELVGPCFNRRGIAAPISGRNGEVQRLLAVNGPRDLDAARVLRAARAPADSAAEAGLAAPRDEESYDDRPADDRGAGPGER